MQIKLRAVPIFLAATLVAACSDSMGPTVGEEMSLSFASVATSSTTALAAATVSTGAAGLSVTIGQNELVISSAQVVLEDIEFESEVATCSRDSIAFADHEGGDRSGHDDCPEREVELGPVVVDLPVDGSVSTNVSLRVPNGTYDELEYELDDLDDDSPREIDEARRHPDLRKNSIRVRGTFNGTPFTYLSDVEGEVELAFDPPLAITEGGFNVTIRVDLPSWFTTAQGDLIDPGSANEGGANEALVDGNILASFHAFDDRDRDGRRDGHSN
jgi:hypothetical protein